MAFPPLWVDQMYTTSLSREELFQFATNRLNRRKEMLFSSVPEFRGEVTENGFHFQRTPASGGRGLPNPRVRFEIEEGNPVRVRITMYPPLVRILFILLGAGYLVWLVLSTETWIINGTDREPLLLERFVVLLLGLSATAGILFLFIYLPQHLELKNVVEQLQLKPEPEPEPEPEY